MAVETAKGYPYPEDTDPADVPADIQALASVVDDNPGIASLTQTEINALAVGDKWAGRVVWNETTATLQVSNGSTFSDVAVSTTLSDATPGQVVAAGSAGVAASASRSDHVHGVSSDLMTTGAWTQVTPTFYNLTVGNGTASARYARFGRLIVADFYINFGSTTSISGNWAWITPIEMQDVYDSTAVGQTVAQDNSTGSYYVGVNLSATNPNRIYTYGSGAPAAAWNASTPFTWTTSDWCKTTVMYEAET